MPPRRYWLMKSEPDVFSIDDLRRAPAKTSGWDGVRNYEARNILKSMHRGDLAFFYHSNSRPSGIAGIVEVVREAYPDPTQAEPEAPVWFQVDVRFREAFPRLLALEELRGVPALKGMALFRRGRLSVQPVAPAEWKAVLALASSR